MRRIALCVFSFLSPEMAIGYSQLTGMRACRHIDQREALDQHSEKMLMVI